jgi:N-formylglutamate amidohydrolase
MTPLLLHVPHNSGCIPKVDRADFLLSDAELHAEKLRVTDWYTKSLFTDGLDAEDIICPRVSRLVVDVERFHEDKKESAARVGMGATYTKTSKGKKLRQLSPARRTELLDRYYWPHHRHLERAVVSRIAAFGFCLILDAHSFPTKPLPTQNTQDASPSICIGTAGVHTPPALKKAAYDFFSSRGIDVAVDQPFAGSMVPSAFMHRSHEVQSIMIEVRRDLYLKEDTGRRHAGFAQMQALLTALRETLLNQAQAVHRQHCKKVKR